MKTSLAIPTLQPQSFENKHFRITLYDLFSAEEKRLRATLYKITETYGARKMAPVIYSMLRELSVNALKAAYKKLFHEHVIVEMGLSEISYEEWLELFKREIEAHKSRNFARISRDKDIGVSVLIRYDDQNLLVRIVNPGQPSELELSRIRKTFENCRSLTSLRMLLEADVTTEDAARAEGGGLGIPMCIMTLRGLNIPAENFRILLKGGMTVAALDLPWKNLRPADVTPGASFMTRGRAAEIGEQMFENFDFAILTFDKFENLLYVSEKFLIKLRIPSKDLDRVQRVIPEKFFSDIFRSANSFRVAGRFENYRIRMNYLEENRPLQMMFNVNGFVDDSGNLQTMWQPVVLPDLKTRLTEGSVPDNLRIQGIVKRYIPQNVMLKALEMAAGGKNELPNEVVEATAVFADIVDFTRLSSTMDPLAVIEMLNLALGLAANAIVRHGGTIDKFMGDAVFALFTDPLDAVTAGVAIQNLFVSLNEIRECQNEPPVKMRIGIHSGQVIMGNIGNNDRLDWTAIGDVINVASRIEKSATAGSVLISDATYQLVRDQVEVLRSLDISVKGMADPLKVYFIRSVNFTLNQEDCQVSIPDHAETSADLVSQA